MIPTTDTLLADYFEHVFGPERATTNKDKKYIQKFVRAIAWLEMTIGRPPTLDDLNRTTLRRMARLMYANGCSFDWADQMTAGLCSLKRHAYRGGVVAAYERPKTPSPDPKQHEFLSSPPGNDTVRRFYLETMRAKQTRAVRSDFDPAIKQLDIMCQRYVILAEVDDDLLSRFALLLESQNKSDTRVDRYVSNLKAIVRKWDSAKFPKRRVVNRVKPLPEPEPGTLRNFFETVHLPQRMIDVQPNTIAYMHRAMRYLHRHYGRDIRLDELTDALAADHLSWLRSKMALKATSINNAHRATIFAVWRHAVELGRVEKLPTIRKFKEEHDEPDSWTSEELARLVEASSVMADRKKWSGPVPLDAWWRAFLLVAYWTGLRAGSIIQIELQHVDLDTQWVYITPRTTKTRRGKRFRLGADCIAAIRAIAEPKRQLLFEWPYRKRRLWVHFRKIQEAAGLPTNGRQMSRLHKVRRSVATQTAANAGMAAAIALLDHSGPEITKRYLDPSRMPGMDATEFLPPLNLVGQVNSEANR